MNEQVAQFGSIIDSLGVRGTLDEGHMVADAVVFMRVLKPEGGSYVKMLSSEGMDWIARRGLLDVALEEDREMVRRLNH